MAPVKPADPGERMFFPRDTLWGWAQFDLAPPHNDIDPNLCAGNAGQYGGVTLPAACLRATCSLGSSRFVPLEGSPAPLHGLRSAYVPVR